MQVKSTELSVSNLDDGVNCLVNLPELRYNCRKVSTLSPCCCCCCCCDACCPDCPPGDEVQQETSCLPDKIKKLVVTWLQII